MKTDRLQQKVDKVCCYTKCELRAVLLTKFRILRQTITKSKCNWMFLSKCHTWRHFDSSTALPKDRQTDRQTERKPQRLQCVVGSRRRLCRLIRKKLVRQHYWVLTTLLAHEYLTRFTDVSWSVSSQWLPQHLVVLAFITVQHPAQLATYDVPDRKLSSQFQTRQIATTTHRLPMPL